MASLAEGRLMEILSGWNSGGIDYFAIFSDPKTVPVRVRIPIDFVVEPLWRALQRQIPHYRRTALGAKRQKVRLAANADPIKYALRRRTIS